MNVEIDLPTDWRRSDTDSPLSLLAQPSSWPRSPIPTITVVDAVTPGELTFDAYVQSELARAGQVFPGHLIHLDVDAGERRMDLAFAFEQLGVDVTTVQRHLVLDGGRSVVATGVAADVDWPAVSATLVGTVRSIRTA